MLSSCLRWSVCLSMTFTLFLLSPLALASDPLMMGVFPRRNAEVTMKQFRPLANYLSKQLKRPVKLETANNFANFWKNVKEQRYDIVHYNQYHYVESHHQFAYDVFAKNEEFGRASIAGAIVVRKDSGIEKLSDLKGKKVLFGGGRKAMVAYIATTYLLRQAGLNKNDYIEVFATNPPNACMGTYLKQVDAGGVGDIVLELPMIKRRIKTEQMQFITTGEALPHIPWAYKQTLPDALRQQISTLMTNLHQTEKGKAILKSAHISRINHANDQEYNLVRKMIYEVTGKQF